MQRRQPLWYVFPTALTCSAKNTLFVHRGQIGVPPPHFRGEASDPVICTPTLPPPERATPYRVPVAVCFKGVIPLNVPGLPPKLLGPVLWFRPRGVPPGVPERGKLCGAKWSSRSAFDAPSTSSASLLALKADEAVGESDRDGMTPTLRDVRCLPLLRYKGIVRGIVPIPGRPVFDGYVLSEVLLSLGSEKVSRLSSASSCSGTSLFSFSSSVSSSAIKFPLEGSLVSGEVPLEVVSRVGEAGPRGNKGEMGLVTNDLLGLRRGIGKAVEELGPLFPVLRGRNRACGGKALLFGDDEDTGEDERAVLSPGGGA